MTPEHLAKLISSGLTPEQALLTGHRSVNAAEAKQLTGHELPGLLLTYTDPSGKPYQVMTGKWAHKPFYRLRPDWAAARHAQKEHYQDADGAAPKYLSPKDCGNRPYFSPLCDWRRVMRKTSELVLLTEGELKGDAGCAYGFPAIAGAGVSAFVDRNSRGEWMAGSDGSAWDIDDGRGDDDDGQPVARFLPELESFPWKNRPVGIVFDSDLTKKFPVRKSLESLLTHVRARAGEGFPVLLPNELDGSKNGLDDFLARHGREALRLIIECFWAMQGNRNAMAKYGPASKLKGGTKIMGGRTADGQPHDGSQACLLKITEPEAHTKAVMTWAVLKEGWAYRPSLGWYRWTGKRWETIGDATLLAAEIGRFLTPKIGSNETVASMPTAKRKWRGAASFPNRSGIRRITSASRTGCSTLGTIRSTTTAPSFIALAACPTLTTWPRVAQTG
ncbi:MAG: DUF3854 domain-containing protein [Synechococcales cyanobacterium RU_4_20]|nr:DUF3854 domain-containing protein [Synechococcales cyanobacterium RU_4_20]